MSKEEFATAGMDNTLRIWDLNKMSESNTLQGVKAFFDIDYSQHSKLIASGSSDRHVRLWDPRTTTGKVSQKPPRKINKVRFLLNHLRLIHSGWRLFDGIQTIEISF